MGRLPAAELSEHLEVRGAPVYLQLHLEQAPYSACVRSTRFGLFSLGLLGRRRVSRRIGLEEWPAIHAVGHRYQARQRDRAQLAVRPVREIPTNCDRVRPLRDSSQACRDRHRRGCRKAPCGQQCFDAVRPCAPLAHRPAEAPDRAVLAALPATRAADCGQAHAGVGTLRTLRQPVRGAAARRAMQGDCSPIGACGPVLSRKSFSYNRIRCVQVAFADKPRVVRPL